MIEKTNRIRTTFLNRIPVRSWLGGLTSNRSIDRALTLMHFVTRRAKFYVGYLLSSDVSYFASIDERYEMVGDS